MAIRYKFVGIPNELSLLKTSQLKASPGFTQRHHMPEVIDVRKLTPLQSAAARGNVPQIKLAISEGAEINEPVRGLLDYPALERAARSRNPDFMPTVLCDGDRFDAEGSIVRTPLFLAAWFGHAQAIKGLLDEGANMKCVGSIGTPANISARRGDVDCMRVFLDAGLDFDARGSNGKGIFHEAIFGGREMMKYLLELEGVKKFINGKDHEGSTPLHLAVKCLLGEKRREMVGLLLQYGANVQARNNDGDTPVHVAAAEGDVDSMTAFTAAGFNINTRGAGKGTVLHSAVLGGEEMMKHVLKLEGVATIINARDRGGSTPLHFAVCFSRGKKRETIKLLLQYGADAGVKNDHGYTPPQLATMRRVAGFRGGLQREIALNSIGSQACRVSPVRRVIS